VADVHQIVFNEISAHEFSVIPTLDQLTLLETFQVNDDLSSEEGQDQRFGVVKRDGKKIYRFRSQDYRLYFTVEADECVVVQRVIHANSLRDFLFRSTIGGSEDQKLGNSRSFWKLIEDGEKSPRR